MCRNDITVFFTPWRVGHFSNDDLNVLSRLVVAVIHRHGIEYEAKIPNVSQQANRPIESPPGFLQHDFPNAVNEWARRITKKICTAELSNAWEAG